MCRNVGTAVTVKVRHLNPPRVTHEEDGGGSLKRSVSESPIEVHVVQVRSGASRFHSNREIKEPIVVEVCGDDSAIFWTSNEGKLLDDVEAGSVSERDDDSIYGDGILTNLSVGGVSHAVAIKVTNGVGLHSEVRHREELGRRQGLAPIQSAVSIAIAKV